MKAVVLSIALVGIAFVLLGCKVLFVKGSKFPMGHHAHHAALRKQPPTRLQK